MMCLIMQITNKSGLNSVLTILCIYLVVPVFDGLYMTFALSWNEKRHQDGPVYLALLLILALLYT